jgi:hypothetical protein
MKRAEKAFVLILGLSLLAPNNSVASAPSRVEGERPYFTGIVESKDVLTDFGSGPSKLTDANPANISVPGVGSRIGNVYFALSGLKGWDLQNSSVGAEPRCSDSSDEECQKIMKLRSYMATLPPCLTSKQSDCISRLSVATADGKEEDALPTKLLGRAIQDIKPTDDGKGFAADASVNLPAGGEKWLWSFPKYKNSSGSLFIPSVSLWQQVNITSMNASYRYPNPNLFISLSPVAVEKSDFGSRWRLHSAPNFDIRRETFTGPDLFTLEFRTTVPWTTWNKASLTDLSITSTKSQKDYIYSIKGRPSSIPEVGKNIKITKENFDDLKSLAGGNFFCTSQDADLSKCSGSIYVGGKGGITDEAFTKLEAVEKLIDKSSENLTYFWLVQTSIETSLVPRVQECTAKVAVSQPAGTISSNATLQQDGPPTWDEQDQAFIYRVGALSKLPSGDDFKGTYTFQLSREMAECIWGKRPTAQSFTVEILDSNQTPQIVTSSSTTLRETFIFNVNGFHFSSPRIIVKERNTQLQKPAPMETASPTKSAVTKTIICIKGKKKRTFIGVIGKKLTCPTGWRKS